MSVESKEKQEIISPSEQERAKTMEFAKDNTNFLNEFFKSSLPAAEKWAIENNTKKRIWELKWEMA